MPGGTFAKVKSTGENRDELHEITANKPMYLLFYYLK
jgi:hypothetical protein